MPDIWLHVCQLLSDVSQSHYETTGRMLVPVNAVGGEKAGTAAYGVEGPISTILQNAIEYESTLQEGKEHIVIGISSVPVTCRVVC